MDIYNIWTEAAAGFSIIFGVGLLVSGKWHLSSVLLSGLFVVSGATLLAANLAGESAWADYWIAVVFDTLFLLSGILFLVYFDSLSMLNATLTRTHRISFVLLLFPPILHPHSLKLVQVRIEAPLHNLFALSGFVLLLVFATLRLLKKLRANHISPGNGILLGFLLVILLATDGLSLFGILHGSPSAFTLFRAVAGLALVYLFFLTQRSLDFIPFLRYESQRALNLKSKLMNIDLESLGAQLAYAMQVQKLYRTEDLRLEVLADEVGISGHQLSEYLNKHEKKNFNQYVNGYRLEEAKSLLAENKTSVLSIALEVGFGSLASFHRFFQKEERMSPGAYRRKARKD